jgi:hypothetical protein
MRGAVAIKTRTVVEEPDTDVMSVSKYGLVSRKSSRLILSRQVFSAREKESNDPVKTNLWQ